MASLVLYILEEVQVAIEKTQDIDTKVWRRIGLLRQLDEENTDPIISNVAWTVNIQDFELENDHDYHSPASYLLWAVFIIRILILFARASVILTHILVFKIGISTFVSKVSIGILASITDIVVAAQINIKMLNHLGLALFRRKELMSTHRTTVVVS